MSLINQMLKDLDARHEADSRGHLHREVRALPEKRDNKALRLAVVALLALTIGAAGWWSMERYLVSTVTRAVPPAVLVESPVAPAVPAASVSSPAVVANAEALSATQNVLPPAADSATRSESVSQDTESGLKLAATIDRLPTVETSGVAPSATVPAQQKAGSFARPAETVSLPKAAPYAAPPKAAAPGAIDKTPAAKTLRERSEADYRRAVGLVNGARTGEATDLLLDVLRQDGGHVASRQLLARLLIEQRRNDEAMAILAEGLAAQPGQVPWAMTLARLQVDRGDLAGAARTLQQSQPFASGNADYQGFAGHVQHRLGHEKESVDFYQAAVRLAPTEGRWWLGLGLSLEADHRAAEAREAFLRARASGSLNADLATVVDQKLR